MSRILPILALLFTGWLYVPPAPVRVRLFSIEQPTEIRITTTGGETIALNARQLAVPFRSAGRVAIERRSADAVHVPYPVEVSARNGTLFILAELPLEDYIAAVLAGESGGFRSDESMKAMAVAARTYAAHFAYRHKKDGFDFCDTTHCQDLRITAVNDRVRSAVNATSNEVLRYDGRPIRAYYHQNCGGVTEPRAPYLRQTRDSFCVAQGRLHWSEEIFVSDLQPVIGLKEIRNIEIMERTASGRVQRLRISGSERRVIGAEDFRLAVGRTLGWNKIRSDLYDVRRSGDRFVFEGHGAGHGIGLCQDGAAVMGEQGRSYREILAYYFPNTAIGAYLR